MASSRRSPPTARVIAVLDHVLTHPERTFGLSELSRELGIAKPTCLGIATTLTEHGYLTCHPTTRAYGIGPALVAAGRLARRATPSAEVAERHLRPLVERWASSCSVSAVVGDEIVVLATVHPGGRSPGPAAGRRYPFLPPVGLMYVVWDEDAALARWLARVPETPVKLDTRHLRTIVRECRRRGYLVEGLSDLGSRLHQVLAGVSAYDLPDTVREVLFSVGDAVSTLGERVYVEADLAAGGRLATNLLAAPTYDAGGRQELVLTLHAGKALTRSEIARRGKALVATAAAVTAEVGGIAPDWGRQA